MARLADDERIHTVFGFDDLKIKPFQNTACDFSHDAGIIDNETGFHFQAPSLVCG